MAVRKIIKIDEEKCNGCGLCVPNCVEGAIRIIDGKAKLIKDSYCDGLGACLGHCPQDALHIVEREADEFDEEAAMRFAAASRGGHGLGHGVGHGGHGGCPGSRMMVLNGEGLHADESAAAVTEGYVEIKIKPQLRQWPVQLMLVPVNAPYYQNADLLVTADCVPFAYPDYHLGLLKGKTVVVGCPKLDDIEHYVEKLTDIFTANPIKSITVAFMEVPCCSGIVRAVEMALEASGKSIPVSKVKIGIDGSKKQA